MFKDEIHELIRQKIISSVLKEKRFIIAANWKMNKNKKEVNDFLKSLNKEEISTKNTIILIPPYPYLYLLEEKLRYSRVLYGVQNIFWEESGAYTGEVSIDMARDFECKYAVIGHSERRNLFMETDGFTGKKVEACLKNGIIPILCVGESLDERKSGAYKNKLRTQIEAGLRSIDSEAASRIVIAYEPVWAIGTGLNATADEVEETHGYIRSVLESVLGSKTAANVPILYGGSVKASNVMELGAAINVSGFLIGGASLKFDEFKKIMDSLA